MGSSSIHIDCPVCHSHYHMGLKLFKGAKGMRLRCRKCGNSLDVLNPAEIGSDENGVNDTAFFRDPFGDRGFEPAVPDDGQEQSTSTEMELPFPGGDPASLSREEEEESGDDVWNKIFLVLKDAPAPSPKPPARRRWTSLFFPFLLLLLFACGSAYLFFTKAGNGMLSGIGRNLVDTVTSFRS